jgi:hypothetical protein
MAAGITFDKTLFATVLNNRRDALQPVLAIWAPAPLASSTFAAQCLAAIGMVLATKIVARSKIMGGEKVFIIAQKELARHVGQGLANLKQEHSDLKDLELPDGLLKFDAFSKMEIFHAIWLLTLVGVPEDHHLDKISPLLLTLESEIKAHFREDSPLENSIFPKFPYPMGQQGMLPISRSISEGESGGADLHAHGVINATNDLVTKFVDAPPVKRKRGRPRKAEQSRSL